ncbi:TIGR03915 family putative DNA repair protein [Clostridium tunisiense]|uniref:TIGR03915 family putative DNA repair protein n=1 Tax=Clostridium tunisiense TaxID=219748 RepID=UPI0002E31211|nr:TIGR03915 family putative DNA repair protein [Clostridium tunisiense]
MIIYVFDGSFEGFLTAIYDSYYSHNKPAKIISRDNYDSSLNLIDEFINIDTDELKSNKVNAAIKKDFSKASLIHIYHCTLSSYEDIYTLLYKFIVLGFKLKKELDSHLHNDIVIEVLKISRRVSLESHRFLGFIRFKNLEENFYYSSIEPDHNILPLIGSHFSTRFKNQNFIIHDIKRQIAIFSTNGKWIIGDFTNSESKNLLNHNKDNIYADLWRTYFDSTTIKERTNSKLQKRMMPSRYWNQLTEVE